MLVLILLVVIIWHGIKICIFFLKTRQWIVFDLIRVVNRLFCLHTLLYDIS